MSWGLAKRDLASLALRRSHFGLHVCTSACSCMCSMEVPAKRHQSHLGRKQKPTGRVSHHTERAEVVLAFLEDCFPGSVDRAEILKIMSSIIAWKMDVGSRGNLLVTQI